MRSVLILALVAAILVAQPAEPRSQSWVSYGPPGGGIDVVEFDPVHPAIAYAGGSSGLFKSTDGGRSWMRRSDGLPDNVGGTKIEIAASQPSTLYFKGSGTNRLWKTTDGARTWQEIRLPAAGSDATDIRSIEVDPTRGERLYLGAFDGLYRTDDGGATWQLLPGPTAAFLIVVAPSAPSVVYANSSYGLYRSNDSGNTWTRLGEGTDSYGSSFVVDGQDPDTIYFSRAAEGMWKSTDGGATERRILPRGGPLEDVTVIAADPNTPGHLYAGGDHGSFWGLFRSTDSGESWTRLRPPFPPRDAIRDVSVSPARGAPVLAAFLAGGVFRSVDHGKTWHRANRGLSSAGVLVLCADQTDPSAFYAGTDFWGGVARSTNAGRNWSRRRLLGSSVVGLASGGRTMVAATNTGVYRSTNHGSNWERTLFKRFDLPISVAVAPSNPRYVYAGFERSHVYRSRDGGKTWHLSARFPLVESFFVHPRNPRIVWASAAGGLRVSKDGGHTWHIRKSLQANGFLLPVSQFAVDPTGPRTVYAAVEGGPTPLGVFKTTDGGAHWRRSATGITTEGMVALVIDKARPRTLYAAGCGYNRPGGVYKSSNGGRSWTNISRGLTTTCVSSLALTRSGRTLQVGTRGGGVFTKDVR